MDKRYLHHLWVRLRPIRYRYLLIIFVISVVVAVFALRQNNLNMIRLRTAVAQADEKGKGVEEALQALREHVYAHMNSDLTSGNTAIRPPVQLTNTYERLVTAERERVAKINKKANDAAVVLCESRFGAGQIQARARCVQEQLSKTGTSEKVIPKELYQFDFVSPVWSPDLAGWSVLISAVFLLLLAMRFGLERWLKHRLDD